MMIAADFLVFARRELPGGIVTTLTKAISEETPADALIEFCNILGVSPLVLTQPELMGTSRWFIVVSNVSRAKFAQAVAAFNWDPIRSDFRAGNHDMRDKQ